MADLDQARRAHKENLRSLSETSGYTGSHVGFRKRGGERTDEVCIVVTVGKKLPGIQLQGKNAAPREIGGVPVDVQEARPETQEDGSPYRPAPGGCSIGHRDITAGTLGAVLRRDGKLGLLSNNHVIANSNRGREGDLILQPGPYDDGRLPIATLRDFVEIVFEDGGGGGGGGGGDFGGLLECLIRCLGGGDFNERETRILKAALTQPGSENAAAVRHLHSFFQGMRADEPGPRQTENLVDAAWGDPYDGDEGLLKTEILEIGEPGHGLVEPTLGLRVQKRGRTTRHTRGLVVGIDASVRVSGYQGSRVALFVDQLVIEADRGDFSAGGDSGSAIVTDDDQRLFVGLLFAGGGGQTIANRFEHVLEAFPGIEL